MPLPKLILVLLAIVALVAFNGCGEGEETSAESTSTESTATTSSSSTAAATGEYGQQLTAIISSFTAEFQAVGEGFSGKELADSAKAFDALERQVETTIGELDALDTPPPAEEGQAQVRAAFATLASELRDYERVASSGDEKAFERAATQAQGTILDFEEQLSAGLTTIAASGVPIEPGAVGG